MLGKAASWGGTMLGAGARHGRNGFNYGAGYLGRTGMSAAVGGVGGGLYGATAGRDYGQSRLGGFMSGAAGGAMLGAAGHRYGPGAYGAGKMAARFGKTGFNGPIGRAALGMRAGAVKTGRMMKGDLNTAMFAGALDSRRFIGNSLGGNKAVKKVWSSLKGGFGTGLAG